MTIRKITTAVFLAASLTACDTRLDVSKDEPEVRVLNRTETGWQSPTALTTMYGFQLIDVRGDKPIQVDLAYSDGGLGDYDVVFIGENHRHPGNHLAQAMIYERLLLTNPATILSLEQFERDTQGTLDQYLAGEIGEWSLRHFGRAWDNYQSSYRPLVEMAKERDLPVIAANAPKDTVVCTGREGLDVLDLLPEARKGDIAAELHTPEEGAYFEKYTSQMRHGAEMSERVLRSYHAQVVRDDTMAESIHLALDTNPGHKLVHLNGHFHSEAGLGTVERVKMRGDRKIAVIQPVMVDDPAYPAFEDSDMESGEYLLLIRPLAEQVITDENRKTWMKTAFKRSEVDCTFGKGDK